MDPSLSPQIRAGDQVLAVGESPVEDVLDFHFQVSLTEMATLLLLSADGEQRRVEFPAEKLGGEMIEFEPMTFKSCGNDCVFCFIHQMPEGLRPDLYFMDEDYRLGFIYGNYVTLALAREKELARIERQHLSPVYVSVHATEMSLRNRLLGLKRSRDIMETLRRLTGSGIVVHTQIVLLPGWNDGRHLDATLKDLAGLWPGVASVGIVPVGLTDHRDGLPELKGYDSAGSREMVEQVEAFQKRATRDLGSRFAYLADEFYLDASLPLPQSAAYEDFPLVDNGIGMARDFVDSVTREAELWRQPRSTIRACLLTGSLGAKLIGTELGILGTLPGLKLEILPVENTLFGSRITVSGLLSGNDLRRAAAKSDADLILLPPNCLNSDNLFLDDLSLDQFTSALARPVLVPEAGMLEELQRQG